MNAFSFLAVIRERLEELETLKVQAAERRDMGVLTARAEEEINLKHVVVTWWDGNVCQDEEAMGNG